MAQTFLNLNENQDRNRRLLSAKGNGRAISVFLVVILLGVSALWLRGEPAIRYVRELGIKLDELAGSKPQTPDREKIEADTPPPAPSQELASAPRPNVDAPMAQPDQPETSDLFVTKMEKSVELAAPVPKDDPPAGKFKSSQARANRNRQESSRKDAAQQPRDLAMQISKAIKNRAILGVDVSVSDGIAYLNGRVATPQQKSAAELAARTVPEVRGIRNRIAIE